MKPAPSHAVRDLTIVALKKAYSSHGNGILNEAGYARSYHHLLLPLVLPEHFEEDLRAGDGNELEEKFRAVHSSAGLAVNCFAPFRGRIGDLWIPGTTKPDGLRFEAKCPTGLRGTPPNLDVLLDGRAGVTAIESKFTEYLSRKKSEFKPAYRKGITDDRMRQGYFAEMIRLMDQPDGYKWLDAAQLIKHAFGLAHTFKGRKVTLLYLYWEPENSDSSTLFAEHRREIDEFADRMSGSSPTFRAISYPELWRSWCEPASTPEWLHQHVKNLRNRYLVRI